MAGDALMALGLRFPLHSYRLENMMADMAIPAGDLRTLCGPPPFSRQEGVRQTVEWIAANPGFSRDISMH